MIPDLYKTYFQKSKVFLFPLLGLKRRDVYNPLNTYIAWSDMYDVKLRKLIVTYENKIEAEWDIFHSKLLINPLFDSLYESTDKKINIYVFDLNIFKEDYDLVIKGRYSQLSKPLKKKIQMYYGFNSPEWCYIESFLVPEKHFKIYAEKLEIKETVLRKIGELCDPLDISKELLVLETN